MAYQVKRRDMIFWRLSNAILHGASKEYQEYARGVMLYGLRSAVRDIRENLSPPPDFVLTTEPEQHGLENRVKESL